jgi:hypothetical protein
VVPTLWCALARAGDLEALAVSALGALTLAGTVAAGAEARPFKLGVTDPAFGSVEAGTRAAWLDRAVDSNATNILPSAQWGGIAPTDPAAGFEPSDPADPGYDFSRVDATVRDVVARGLDPTLLVTGAPLWAEGKNRPNARYIGRSVR